MKPSIWRNNLITLISAVVLILIWHAAAVITGAEIILPRPSVVFQDFISFFSEPDSWAAIGATVIRALRSFFIILVSGIVLGLAGGQSAIVRAALQPLLSVIRATPVLAVILLAFIWFRTGTVPVFTAFLMGFPVLYQNVTTGIEHADRRLNEMGKVYGLSAFQRLIHITIPSLLPFILAGARGALGMTWKVVIASEVITVPKHGIGTSMQFAQINLQTSIVMGWTLVAVLLTMCSDMLFDGLVSMFADRGVHQSSPGGSRS